MKVIILAAGYATRLYPLTLECAKPLLKLGDKPIIEFVIDKLNKIDAIDTIYVVTNQKFVSDFVRWKDQLSNPKTIRIISDGTTSDDDKLGAVGDIDFVVEKEKIEDELMVIAGDNVFDFSLNDFVDFYRLKGTAVGLYRLGDLKAMRRFGEITLDSDKRIVGFREKPQDPKSDLLATCLYLFSPDAVKLVSQYLLKGGNPDAPGYYIQWLYTAMPIYGHVFSGTWYDIGSRELYAEAQQKLGTTR